MRIYIDHGRFGEFVEEVIRQENNRRKEQAERDEDEKLWIAYVHSYSDKSFIDWKAEIIHPNSATTNGKSDSDITKKDIDNIMNRLFHSAE